MFKCVDCGMEYEIKPDFCDCGNNVFEEINPQPKTSPQPAQASIPKQKHKKTFDEQYPGLSDFIETLDPISVCIFVLCIILSIASLIFIKPKEQPETAKKEEVKIERKVANIESFWNNTPPKAQKNIPKQEEQTIANQITNMISQMTDQKPQQTAQKPVSKPTVQTQKPATQTKVLPKPKQQKTGQNKPSPAKTTQKPVQQTQKKSQQTQQKTQQQPAKTTQSVQQKPQQSYNQPSVNTAAIQAQAAAKAAQELKSFKTGLRNTLFSKLNFTRVYGDGDCIVVFKVDSTGRLTNKSFSKQSTNNTLNDEVYQAIMSTPVYKAPPSSYHNETLHFSVKFRGGQYEVSLY